jgi:signal transduction histidine kinase
VHSAFAGLYTLVALGVALPATTASVRWIDETFPGFFLMDNRVVPSVSLGHWTGGGSIMQSEVVAVDGEPVITADAVYRQVRESDPDRPHTYTLRRAGKTHEHEVRSMRFTPSDYLWFFGPLIVNGIVFTAVGIAVWVLGRPSAATGGAALLTLNVGLFCLTAPDLYGPGRFFRLHASTEALLPATMLYLALVFPVARLRRYRSHVSLAIAALGLGLVAVYQKVLYIPVAYSLIHNTCMVLWGVSGVYFIGSSVHAFLASPSVLVRKRLGIVALGIVVGLSVPACVMTWSGLFGGEAALNLAGFTAFVFPLSLAYAVVKHDLFEIDAMLRRGLSYLAVTGVVVVAYAGLVLGAGLVLQSTDLAGSPVFALVFSVLMILFFNPIRQVIQQVIDRGFHRTSHNAQLTLESASSELASTLALEDIYRLTIETPCTALLVDDASLWMRNEDGELAIVERIGAGPRLRDRLANDHPLVARLRRARRALTVYDCDAQEEAGLASDRGSLAVLNAELVLPIGIGDLAGFLALGPKRSQTLYTLDDLAFLTTFANQVAVAVRNAQAYRKIEHLNLSLEQKVAERTTELEGSLRALEDAYAELQQSQERLIHAEKMAALGRLTSGIAHEVNTPLGATMNGLKIVADLADEYARSIGDPEVTPDDHREMAAELQDMASKLTSWSEKAAGYIRGIKAHTRGIEGGREERFEVRRIFDDLQGLLSHRLRLSSCTLTVDCRPDLQVYGDPSRLSQVVTNLVTNAIDAYEGQPTPTGEIRVRAVETSDGVEISVADDGSGISPEHLERIFDELFSTKPQGKGTGLGLSIARDIIQDSFRGRIDVDSAPGRGSRFTLTLPHRSAPRPENAAA